MAVLLIVVFSGTVSANGRIRVDLLPLAGAPNASGEASLKFEGGVATGTVKARGLPAQAFGSGRFLRHMAGANRPGQQSLCGRACQP
ncbi:MAG: hypothetical protein ACT4PY_05915, partial [Armatimonadota bacterium]